MDFKIFYSWQSRTQTKFNKNFILSCIEAAVKKVKKELNLKESGINVIIDRDTHGVSGTPEIMNTIKESIRNADIFIGDLSIINKPVVEKKRGLKGLLQSINNRFNPPDIPPPLQNVNVFQEYGIAIEALGLERIIGVLNTAYGDPDENSEIIPFDIRHMRWPIKYHYDRASENNKDTEKQKLINALSSAIKEIVQSESVRQKDEFSPFEVYSFWAKVLNPKVPFVGLNILENEIKKIRETAATNNKSLRILGLSAIGKTRLVFEALSDKYNGDDNKLLNQNVLYVNCYDVQTTERIIDKAKQFILKGNHELVLVADNCDFETFKKLNDLLKIKDNKFSLISIYSDPDEQYRFHEVDYILLDHLQYIPVIEEVLSTGFPELSKADVDKIKELCQGLTQFAILIAEEIKAGHLEIRNITDKEILDRIIGALGNTSIRRDLLKALSIFLKVGYYDDLNSQFDIIISDPDIVGPSDKNVLKIEFDNMCEQLKRRGLLEKEGRFISIRPKPIAVALAAEWWQSCSPEKAARIIEKLKDHHLGQLLCDQMKFLSFLQEARENVKNLCGENAPFGSAEVLKTDKGSRLFRSLVEVNPEATMSGLEIAFRGWTIDQLRTVDDGRRNLIWALEKLCFRDELFDRASKMMGLFALAENETHISNNATGQFLHLFQIQLAGTQANLNARLNTIHWLLSETDEYQRLAIKAMSRALTTSGFTRMVGAEHQGASVALKDYQPTGKEIYDYWKTIIALLSEIGDSNETCADLARKTLFEKFGGLAISGGFELIFPYLNALENLNSEEWKEVRSTLLRVKKYHLRYLKADEREKLIGLIKKYSPQNLQEKYLVNVSQPSLEDIEDYRDYNETAKRNAIDLAVEVADSNQANAELFPIIYTGQQQFGYYFGNKLSEMLLLTNTLDHFLKDSIEYIDKHRKDVRIPVLGGLLSKLSAQSKTQYLQQLLGVLSESDIFWLFSILDLPLSSLNLLTENYVKLKWDIRSFLIFKFGTGIRHLSQSDIISFFDSISGLCNEGKGVATQLAYYLQYNEPAVKDFSFNYIGKMMAKDNLLLLGAKYLDAHTWQECVQQLVNISSNKEDTVRLFLDQIIEYCSERKSIVGEFDMYIKNVFGFFVQNYFNEFWSTVSKALEIPLEKSIVRWNLKNLLETNMGFEGVERSVLFNISDDKFTKILDWCRENPVNNAPAIAQMVYLYEQVNNKFTWHHFAKSIIDEFGNIEEVLSSLSANIGTYGWSGSVVPLLTRQKRMFEELLDHKIPAVREWAGKNIEYLSKNIKQETYRDEEWGL